MIRDLVIGLWPLWLFLVCVGIFVVGLCRAAAFGDEEAARGLSELEARRAVRPSPAPIDVEPLFLAGVRPAELTALTWADVQPMTPPRLRPAGPAHRSSVVAARARRREVFLALVLCLFELGAIAGLYVVAERAIS